MHYERHFESADAFFTAALHEKNEEGYSIWDAFGHDRDMFYGCHNREHAERLARFGWPLGRQIVERMRTRIERSIGRVAPTHEVVWDVVGGSVDIGAYVSGVPECMMEFVEAPSTEEKFVDIHFSSGVNAGVTDEEMAQSGAAVAALVDALEASGKRCRVVWERSSENRRDETCSVTVVLKDYQHQVDLDRLAFFMTSPCARRALAWAIYAMSPDRHSFGLSKGCRSPYSSPWDNPKYIDKSDIWTGAMIAGTEQASAKWVQKKLATLGITVESR